MKERARERESGRARGWDVDWRFWRGEDERCRAATGGGVVEVGGGEVRREVRLGLGVGGGGTVRPRTARGGEIKNQGTFMTFIWCFLRDRFLHTLVKLRNKYREQIF
jgi:hypothetical protein